MKIKTDYKKNINDDNLLPLVNIIFLLLIFFMLAGVIAKQKELHDVQLSVAQLDEYIEQGTNVLFIQKDGTIFVNNQIVNFSDLKRTILKLDKEELILAADAAIDSSGLQKVLLILTESKIKNIISSTSFEKMKNLEKKQSFSEASVNKKTGKSIPFFYLGDQKKSENLLDAKNKDKIENIFRKEMEELGYL